MSQYVKFVLGKDKYVKADMNPEIELRLRELIGGATMGWIQLAPDYYLNVAHIMTFHVIEKSEVTYE